MQWWAFARSLGHDMLQHTAILCDLDAILGRLHWYIQYLFYDTWGRCCLFFHLFPKYREFAEPERESRSFSGLFRGPTIERMKPEKEPRRDDCLTLASYANFPTRERIAE